MVRAYALIDPSSSYITTILVLFYSYFLEGDAKNLDREFELFGILFGLAIYNGVILDVHFPVRIEFYYYQMRNLSDCYLQKAFGAQAYFIRFSDG